MTVPAIEVEGLGKRYRLGEDASQHHIVDVLMPWRKGLNKNEFWALRDVSFRIGEGESVGIIGENGAGKSTLLKVLSRITAPTTGRARVRGRVGTLLEVGTGFHPELSGRDNIFLSGTILGLSYREVKTKLDEIIEFSGVEKFIDTPVKRYSSGMQVKLAFSVALYLEPEILIIDEVLAVGDLAFQRKSLNRLNEVTGQDHRTILFVSHSLDAVKKSCQRVIVLEGGSVKFDGASEEGIEFYRSTVRLEPVTVKDANLKDRRQRTSGKVRFNGAHAYDSRGKLINWSFKSGQTATFRFEYEVREIAPNLALLFRLLAVGDSFSSDAPQIIANIQEIISKMPLPVGYEGVAEIVLPNIKFRACELALYVCLESIDGRESYDVIDANVDLPRLVIQSSNTGRHARFGLVEIEHEFRNLSTRAIAAAV